MRDLLDTRKRIFEGKIEVRTDKYIFVTKKKPSGFGNWFFKIGKEDFQYNGNYTEAKKQAEKRARELNVTLIEVLP